MKHGVRSERSPASIYCSMGHRSAAVTVPAPERLGVWYLWSLARKVFLCTLLSHEWRPPTGWGSNSNRGDEEVPPPTITPPRREGPSEDAPVDERGCSRSKMTSISVSKIQETLSSSSKKASSKAYLMPTGADWRPRELFWRGTTTWQDIAIDCDETVQETWLWHNWKRKIWLY